VEGAQVMVLNEEGMAVTDVARTDGMGNYDLKNVPAKRNADGSPAGTYTVRAAAQEYQAFPSGARVPPPIALGDATSVAGKYTLDSTLTNIGLIPLGVGERSSMSGTIYDAAEESGALVVARGANGVFSGLSDKSRNWTIFNLPPGDYEFRAYALGMQIKSASATVGRDPLSGLYLGYENTAGSTTTVTGSVQLNAPGGALTSVMLVVADTFDPLAARGEAPPGLRSPRTGSPDVSGNFSISGVPNGRYVVLPAYENDDLVRDHNTDFVTIDVTGTFTQGPRPPPGTPPPPNVDLTVTAALPTISPGAEAPEAVTTKPKLVWGDDSSADYYDVRVFDAFAVEVWNSLMLPGVSGPATASVQYAGPLEPGMYYHFRVTSWRAPDGEDPAPIAATEDLRGVFYLPAP
ncbi:MAG TPA: hypothetical protein VJV79_24820, partial [Polyangiaceae bacterium]|nr:hypothetical protein [Polyangiaceae bacterium]